MKGSLFHSHSPPLSLSHFVSGKEMHMTYNVSSSRVHQLHYSDFFASLSPLLSVFSFTHTHETSCPSPHLLQAVVFTLSYILYKPSPSAATPSSPFPASICLSISRGFLVVCVCEWKEEEDEYSNERERRKKGACTARHTPGFSYIRERWGVKGKLDLSLDTKDNFAEQELLEAFPRTDGNRTGKRKYLGG